jgi:predicted phage tail protein
VKWTAPANTGGSPITSYIIRAYRLGAVVGTRTAPSTARSLVLTGLGNGLSYSFTVAAVNAVGTGPFSATSNSVVPKGVSYAPVIGTATAGVASATARWTAPTNNGGSAITSYLVRTYRTGVLINTKQVAATARSLTLTALIKGQPHRFAVAAVNAIGTSGYSAQSNTVYPT